MDFNLNWIYIGISWLLLRWHDVWGWIFHPDSDVSWVLAIIFVVLTVRVILIPVVVKQIKSQRAMQVLQPRMTELRTKYKNDPQTLRVEMAKLIQEEKANPLMGCLPLLLQTPVLIGLFHVLRCINPLSHTSQSAMVDQYGWSMEQFQSVTGAKLFGAPIAASFRSKSDILHELGAQRGVVQIVALALVLTMVATTYITQRQMIARSGGAAEGPQAMVQKLMLYGIPATLLISGFIFPIGVLIYWVITNLFSMVQQFWILKKMPPINHGAKDKPAVDAQAAKALAPKPGVKPGAKGSKSSKASPASSDTSRSASEENGAGDGKSANEKSTRDKDRVSESTAVTADVGASAAKRPEDKSTTRSSSNQAGSTSKKQRSRKRKGGRI